MGNLENRVARLESARANVSLQALSDAELSAHIATLPLRSPEQYSAIITLVLRHPSAFPVVRDDPAYKIFGGQGGRV